MRLIGINGFKGAGKDACYQAICEVGVFANIQRRGFADRMKMLAAESLGHTGYNAVEKVMLMDDLKAEGRLRVESGFFASLLGGPVEHMESRFDIDGRDFLINLGQSAKALFGEDFWIDQVLPVDSPEDFKKVWYYDEWDQGWLDEPDVGVVPDVRFENEAYRVLNQGGEVWQVVRPGVESDGKVSEQPLPPEYITHTIVNDSDLQALQNKVRALL